MSNKASEEQLESIFPEVIGAVITIDGDRVNLCPVNFQAVSTKYENPTTVCIGLGNASYTLKNILASKQFVYTYPTPHQLKDIIYCGTVSGKSDDKLKNTELMFTDSADVKPPNLKDAVINFECTLKHSYVAGDFTIVIAEVTRTSGGNGKVQKIYSLGKTKYGTIITDEVIQDGR